MQIRGDGDGNLFLEPRFSWFFSNLSLLNPSLLQFLAVIFGSLNGLDEVGIRSKARHWYIRHQYLGVSSMRHIFNTFNELHLS
jgi:hypothetical protein